MKDLQVALIQSDIYWHEVDANLASFEEKIWQVESPVDLILLPEMFNTGFSMEVNKNAEMMKGKTFKWLQHMAAQKKAVIAGSFTILEDNNYYNRLVWMTPSGEFSYYDKRHLFRMTGEHNHFSSGDDWLIQEIEGWKINPMICYDLRFPLWSRNILNPENESLRYDVAVYVANWPSVRINAWDILLKARAVENSCYVIGLNRTGKDGNGVSYDGHSNIIDPNGLALLDLREGEFIEKYSLSGSKLNAHRKQFPSHLDADNFKIIG